MSRAAQWQCIAGCGACCRLDPSQRPEALEALSEEQRSAYLALVGDDGWCIHYDTGGRRCRVYEERPDFCRVENLVRLFFHGSMQGLAADGGPAGEPTEADALAIACCRQQIRSEYGGRSREMRRFQQVTRPRR
ncbi:MAG: YkgJ family cysteine cluster protein [Synechococcus sp.]|nr:YkgJ family cysteine cluster protein [Synechococcus sp.]